MVRNLAMLVGAAFVTVLAWALFWTVEGQITDPAAKTAVDEFHLQPKELDLESNGVFGKFDARQLQRGFQVYKEVCANCHSLGHVAFRDLSQIGYSDAQVKKIAADWAPSSRPSMRNRAIAPSGRTYRRTISPRSIIPVADRRPTCR